MRARSVLLCAVVGAFTVVAPVGAATAAAPAAQAVAGCGDVVDGEAYLAADLTCEADVGLTLRDGADLDLRGHALVGRGSGDAVRYQGDATVRNGTVTGWGTGLAPGVVDELERPLTVQVRSVRFVENGTGVVAASGFFGQPAQVDVVASRFERNRTGLSGNFGSGFDVRGSRFVENGEAASVITAGITVTGSQFDGNGLALSCDESGCLLEGNVLRDNALGVRAWVFGADLTRNVVTGGDVGFEAVGAWGGSTLRGNVFRDVGTAVRLSSATATLVDNVFTGNGVGFTAEGDDPFFTAALEGNRFVRNGDGIVGVGVPTTLQGNVAVANRGWGIHAPGATDLGGNVARANGTDPQCVGVAC
ncbi:NosD domain-containing protein [Cellulomonas sp. ATA003]|uniref:NosD domain-containing protein n=1 Tax=Cellulomonas sp. ATA003 TaxID=3073064 RepID=UPI0028737B42|nr:NosD domain-containing protein [Cellulomonas sp. ATA003]WNB85132.1 NosD domain-containing protein [Cellulomonas sp. ATA003]